MTTAALPHPRPDAKDVAELRIRYDIEQLTPMGRAGSSKHHH